MAWLFKGPDYYTDKLLKTHTEWAALAADDEAGRTRVGALLQKYSGKLKDTMYGDGAKEPQPAQCDKLARAWIDKSVLPCLQTVLRGVDFESRKNLSMIFCALVRGDHAGFASTALTACPTVVRSLIDEYADYSMALVVGPMIREGLRVPAVHACILGGGGSEEDAEHAAVTVKAGVRDEMASIEAAKAAAAAAAEAAGTEHASARSSSVHSDPANDAARVARNAVLGGMSRQLVELVGRWAVQPQFEVAGDAFATLTWLLRDTEQKDQVRAFLLEKTDTFFPLFMALLEPWTGRANFTVQLQALKLLVEVLLDRDNFEVMVGFIKRTRHLRAVMKLLRSTQSAVQFEAFHVFKIFVANPHKPDAVVEVLLANKDKLTEFLRGLQNDRQDDLFHDEKALLIETLEGGLVLPEGYEAKLIQPRQAMGLDRPPPTTGAGRAAPSEAAGGDGAEEEAAAAPASGGAAAASASAAAPTSAAAAEE